MTNEPQHEPDSAPAYHPVHLEKTDDRSLLIRWSDNVEQRPNSDRRKEIIQRAASAFACSNNTAGHRQDASGGQLCVQHPLL